MLSKLAAISRFLGFSVLSLLALQVGAISALRYVAHALPAPPPILDNLFANPFLMLHVLGGIVALLLGPFQFVGAIRNHWPRIHRLSGRTYVAACAIGGPAGIMLSLGTTAGPVAGSGFAMLGLLLTLFTALGLRAAIGCRFDDHRDWMIRSYAMVAAAITLRLMIPVAGMLEMDFLAAYRAIAWLSWIVNLLVAEWLVRRPRLSATRGATLAPA